MELCSRGRLPCWAARLDANNESIAVYWAKFYASLALRCAQAQDACSWGSSGSHRPIAVVHTDMTLQLNNKAKDREDATCQAVLAHHPGQLEAPFQDPKLGWG